MRAPANGRPRLFVAFVVSQNLHRRHLTSSQKAVVALEVEKALMRRTAQDIIEIGRRLIEVKARLGHGQFGAWLATEFEWSQDTATRFMNVAARFSNIPQIAEFAPSALYLLAAPSTPDEVREEALERAEAGERITYSTARALVDEHKTPRAAPPAPAGPRPTSLDPYERVTLPQAKREHPSQYLLS